MSDPKVREEQDRQREGSGARHEKTRPGSDSEAGQMVGVIRFELTASTSRTQGDSIVSDEPERLTEDGSTVCARVCTGDSPSEPDTRLREVAAAIRNLTPAERIRLSEMLADTKTDREFSNGTGVAENGRGNTTL